MVVGASLVIAAGTAYAANINNPGPVAFSGNGDSKITSYGGGGNMFLNAGGMSMVGVMASDGSIFFDEGDLVFDVGEDANGYRYELDSDSDGTGTYCPLAKSATITFEARICITKVAGTDISTAPCYITINGKTPFTLTTETSGSLTGARFSEAEPKLVAEVSLDATIEGALCSNTSKTNISNYYGLATTPDASITIFQASMNPSNFTGTGC